MTTEENVQVVKDADDAYRDQEWDRFLSFHSESVVVHSPELAEPSKGRESLRKIVEGYYAAFPDMVVKRERIFGQGDSVFLEQSLAGTNTGPMTSPTGEEVPPTNKPIQVWQALVFRVENGQIQEARVYFDQLSMLAQLGLGPSE